MEDILVKSDYIMETERLILSLIELDDADQLFPNMSNQNISVDMSWKPHETIDETLGFIENVHASFSNGKSVTWCIRLKSDIKTIIGIFSIISIVRQHRELIYDKAELAYWIAPFYEKKGYMSESAKAVLAFGFEKLKLHKFVVSHHINNENSKKLILRLNFRHTYIEEQAFMKNNIWIDVAHYELLKIRYQKNAV
ncbi:MAG: GNAT family N-acetyltransferase [Ferruginibacter sp.]